MSGDGTSFTIDLPVTGGAKIDAAAASVDTLAARLDSSSKAAQASEGSYSKAEASADRAAKALERVGLAADLQRAKLRAASEASDTGAAEKAAAKLRDLVVEQSVLAERAKSAKTALEAEALALDKVATSTKDVGKADEAASSKTEEFFDKFDGLDRGLNKIGGPLASTIASVADLGEGFGKLVAKMGPTAGLALGGASALVALAVAVTAATVAVAAMTIKLGLWAVSLADAARTSSLLAQGIARSVSGGEELDDKLSDLTKQLPLTRDELSSMAQKLADGGLRGKALTDALETSAIAAAKLKFGPDFSEEMLSLNDQSKVFHANLSDLFGGLKIDGVLQALQKLIGLFDASSSSGRAIKVVFESIFQPLLDGLAKSEPKIEAFFLQLEIWALKALILFKPHASIVLKIGEAFAIVAALIGTVLVAAIGIAAAFLVIPIALFTALVFGVIEFKDHFLEAFNAVKDFLSNFNLADIGKAMIAGLVNGIKEGGAAILSAVTGAMTGAVGAAKKALGIASPSKVFAEIGLQTGAGMAAGVDSSAGNVQGSLEDMVSPPAVTGGKASPAASSAGPAGGSSGGAYTFNLYGVEGADDAVSRIKAVLIEIVEGSVSQFGGAVPA